MDTTNAWISVGLKPQCITWDLKWGVPVPLEKFKDKVFSVWFDAPIGYISVTACYTSDWEKWWKNPENVELFQFIGKDNVPFHTVKAGHLMKTIIVTEYLKYEAGNFSKSKGMGVFGDDAKATSVPVEVWRYYLLTNRPEADFQAKQNNELLKNLSNFIHRSLSFVAKPSGQGYGSVIPDAPNADAHTLTAYLGERVGKLVEQYIEAMEKVKLKQGLRTAMSISSEGNGYLDDSQFWNLYNEDPAACSIGLKTSVGLVHLLVTLLEPFMASFSYKVVEQLNLPHETLSLFDEKGDIEKAKRPWDIVPAGHAIGKPEPLFSEMKDEEVDYYRKTFSGSQADRTEQANAEAAKVSEQIRSATISES